MSRAYKRTARKPIVIDGIVFESYRTGIGQYALFVGDPTDHLGRLAMVRQNFSGATYSATVNGRTIGKRFRTEESAMRAVAFSLNSD
jgi:hypothetical protein